MQPDISVIVTSYNTARYISRAIDSALAQEGVTLEVIVVDDVSTDTTWEIITSYSDPRIKSQRLAHNSGPSVARNTAIAMASGQWLAVLDSDDAYEPGRLARLLQLAKANRADIAVDNLLVYREADGATFPMFEPARLAAMPRLTLAGFIRGNQSFLGGFTLGYVKPLVSREFLARHHLAYDPDIRIGEDYFLLASALALGAVCVVDASAGYRYTVRQSSISHRLQPADVERINACDAKLLGRFTLKPEERAEQQRRTRNLALALAFTQLVEAIKTRNLKSALGMALRQPMAALQMWRPVAVRVQRLFGRAGGNRG